MSLFKPQKRKTPLGIYIHVPFCRSKCAYCDFYSLTQPDAKALNGYLDAICDHIRETGPLAPDYLVDTVYFGGGTPALAAGRLKEIIDALQEHFIITEGIGVELHPDNVTVPVLQVLKDAGVTKISIGIHKF